MKQLTLALVALLASLFTAEAARVDTIQVPTKYLATPEDITVIVPDAAAQGKKFPTVYLLNGYGGDHFAWLRVRPDLPELADNYGMVIVMPDGRDSWYWDSPVNPAMQMESFFTKDLVPYVDKHYPTLQAPEYRAISGLSMGGQGSMYLAIRHNDIWGNAGSTSGGLDIRPFPERWKMKESLGTIEQNPQAWEEHTPINLIKDITPGSLNMIFDCGSDDFFAGVNKNFHEELLKNKIPHDYISRPGGHSGAYWNNSVLYHLLYFNEAFKKAAKK
ncbi:MAG: esterase family protein [Muribaculaceae bacterium]|nr:esterase family protein [Muribaculaceae bacterium]